MPPITWDALEDRTYETGVDHGVLYIPDVAGKYGTGVAWNGLVNITQSPSGGEPTPFYADNIKYLNLMSVEEFGATIEAYTYPEEFDQFDGGGALAKGVRVGQQNRKTFGLSYRTLKGNATQGTDFGYKLHLIYGCLAAPSEKAHATVNDTPEPITFSWTVSTTPIPVGVGFKPTAHLSVDSTEVDATDLKALEDLLYGSGASATATLPTPAEVAAIFAPAG